MQDLHASPLNKLLKKDKSGVWTAECQEAFEKIKKKKRLTSDLFLTHCNPVLDIIVASDTSSYGVGSCILHKMAHGTTKPIAHASRALHHAEKNYSQIEKEALGIIFEVSKFHCFIHSRHFTLQTDNSHYLPFLAQRKFCLLTQPIKMQIRGKSCLIIILKWCTYHRINSAKRTNYQG